MRSAHIVPPTGHKKPIGVSENKRTVRCILNVCTLDYGSVSCQEGGTHGEFRVWTVSSLLGCGIKRGYDRAMISQVDQNKWLPSKAALIKFVLASRGISQVLALIVRVSDNRRQARS